LKVCLHFLFFLTGILESSFEILPSLRLKMYRKFYGLSWVFQGTRKDKKLFFRFTEKNLIWIRESDFLIENGKII
jgi:hypothetical protein